LSVATALPSPVPPGVRVKLVGTIPMPTALDEPGKLIVKIRGKTHPAEEIISQAGGFR
jgi:hypothetical protein